MPIGSPAAVSLGRARPAESPAGRPPAAPAPTAEGEEEDPQQRPREEPDAAAEDGEQQDAGHDHCQRHQPGSRRREGGTLTLGRPDRPLAALLTGPPLGRQVGDQPVQLAAGAGC
jgi:hypothetical protein